MNDIKIFEGQKVSVITNDGNKLINLVHVAKCCGLTRTANSGNEVVRWTSKGITEKLTIIRATDVERKYMEEISYILDEIENTDDRNSIYMSSWLSKRLALECHSERAMRFKNFLVTLDEARESNELVSSDLAPQVLQLAQGMQMMGQVVSSMQSYMVQMQEYVKDSIQAKDSQLDKAIDLIGIRSINKRHLTELLKNKLAIKHNKSISASSSEYLKVKNMVFKEFNISKWEDISASKYNKVHAFIDEVV